MTNSNNQNKQIKIENEIDIRMKKKYFFIIGILFFCSIFAYVHGDTISNKPEANKETVSNDRKVFDKNAFESWNVVLIVAVQILAVIATFIGLRIGSNNIKNQINATKDNLFTQNYLDRTKTLIDAIANIIIELSKAKEDGDKITKIINGKPCSVPHLNNEMRCIMLLNKTEISGTENALYESIVKYRNGEVSEIDVWIKEIEENSQNVMNNRLNNN